MYCIKLQNQQILHARDVVRAPPGFSQGPGGPDKLSSLRNNHMTILHSSLHKYIHKYIHTHIIIVRAYNIE